MNTAREFTTRLTELLGSERRVMAEFLGASSNLGDVLE
jgi:hypothetical protein